jgi:hypothetical protein
LDVLACASQRVGQFVGGARHHRSIAQLLTGLPNDAREISDPPSGTFAFSLEQCPVTGGWVILLGLTLVGNHDCLH